MVLLIKFGQPVLMLAWLSMQKQPQNNLLRSSNSVQFWGGGRTSGSSISGDGLSIRWSPIISTSLMHLAELMPDRVKSMQRASSVATRAQACAWPTVMKCCPKSLVVLAPATKTTSRFRKTGMYLHFVNFEIFPGALVENVMV